MTLLDSAGRPLVDSEKAALVRHYGADAFVAILRVGELYHAVDDGRWP